MTLVSVDRGLAACSPQVQAVPEAVDAIRHYLVPVAASFISTALEHGQRDLAALLLSSLKADPSVHFLDKRRRARLVATTAVRINAIPFAEIVFEHFYCAVDEEMLRAAVRSGHLEALQWLHATLPGPQDATATELSLADLPDLLSRDLLVISTDLCMLQTLLEQCWQKPGFDFRT